MSANLLRDTWANLDSLELGILLRARLQGHGQYDNRGPAKTQTLFLPLAGPACRIQIDVRDGQVVDIVPGEAFDKVEWKRISEEIDQLVSGGSSKVGREFSFSSFRVDGSWRGALSGVQILPPPDHAPQTNAHAAQNPFILEFPIKGHDLFEVTNHRRHRVHRDATLLLNILLVGHISFQRSRSNQCWANVAANGEPPRIEWVQQWFYADIDKILIDSLSLPRDITLIEIDSDVYYSDVAHDGRGLRVPADLDQMICLYQNLSSPNRVKFDRAAFWMDMAYRQWNISTSTSFISLVTAVESLTERGAIHRHHCDECNTEVTHDAPGPTKIFRDFFELHAPGMALKQRRGAMYELRSALVHGNKLMQLDDDLTAVDDLIGWNEYDLQGELWELTRAAIRSWLKNPSLEYG